MKKFIIAAAMTAALAGPALANKCPSVMAKIDEAMKTTTVDEATKVKVAELYAKGKTAHETGDHAASVTDLEAALKLLGM